MADRTVKMFGKAFSENETLTVTVEYNNQQVFSGTVLAVNEPATSSVDWQNQQEICTWTVPIDQTGAIPLSITVTGGDLMFSTLQFNYLGDIIEEVNGELVVTTSSAENFGDPTPNTIESDGKDNVVINGEAQERNATEEQLGEWQWLIPNGGTLTCDIQVTAAVDVA